MKDLAKSLNDWGIIQKKNKSSGKLEWYARIVRTDGSGKKKQYTQRADSKAHARRLRNQLTEKYKDRGEQAIEGDKLLFKELAQTYKEKKLFTAVYHGEGKSKRKVGGLRSVLGPLHYLEVLKEHFGNKLIRNISHNDIEEFKCKRLRVPKIGGGERSITDVNRCLEQMRAILRFAIRQGWLNRSPFEMGSPLISRADENRREVVLSAANEASLLNACSGRRSHLRPLIVTALDTAMRRGELFKLRWQDVSFEARTIVITAMNSKTAKERAVGMTRRVYAELASLRDRSAHDPADVVFGIKDTVKTSFTSACKEAGINDLHFHDLRHTAITRMIQAGLAPMEVMKISGHTQMTTFVRYVNPNTDAVQRIADALSSFNENAINSVQNETDFVN
jgi:integrase